MIVRGPVRLRRRHERGVTLIEMLVAIAIMGFSLVAIAGTFGTAQKAAVTSQDLAGLDVSLRDIGDTLRSPTVTYKPCSIPSSYAGVYGRVTILVTQIKIDYPTGEQQTAYNGTSVTVAPRYDCGSIVTGAPLPGTPSTCPAGHVCDWGVQRLTVTVTSTTRDCQKSGGPAGLCSQSRVVWKGIT